VNVSSCTLCSTRAYLNLSTIMCSRCLPGIKSSIDSNGCIPCPVGKYSLGSGASQCQSCAAGRFASAVGSTKCTFCPKGTFSNIGDELCTPCPAGKVSTLIGASSCSMCGPGKFYSVHCLSQWNLFHFEWFYLPSY
jgi:hypothetical protein